MARSSGQFNPLISFGFVALGTGYLYEWWKHNRSTESGVVVPTATSGFGLLDRGGPNYSPVPWHKLKKYDVPVYGSEARGKGVRSVRLYPAGDIAQRENYIIDQVRKDSLSPGVISAARSILSERCPVVQGGVDWCVRPKDWDGEVRAFYEAVVNPNSPYAVRYTRDHTTVDQFASSALMQRIPAEDCDGMMIRLGSFLRAVGYHVRTRVVAPRGAPGQWAHIYLTVSTPAGSRDNFRPLDPTEPEKTIAGTRKYPYFEVGTDIVDPKRRDRDI